MIKKQGQIIYVRFPQTDLEEGKFRPALLFNRIPGEYDDWLICLMSTQLRHFVSEFDEIVYEKDDDFIQSGLKKASLIRIGRLAVVEGSLITGTSGQISQKRFERIRGRLLKWFAQ